MKKYCLAVDLIDDPVLIDEYENWHKSGNVWPEIIKSIKDTGITDLEIYRVGNRLFMIMETDDSFSFERKSSIDASNSKTQEWEALMWRYQQSIPFAQPGEKWLVMNKIFQL
ncbi:MAG: L-rhamnose mutarotase [Chitinophagaceae bacterium]|nr:L-rhamnose mutarotase [Chitinophagaceae bacterium]